MTISLRVFPLLCSDFMQNFNTAIIEMTTNDKKQSHERGMGSQHSKVVRNGKSCGGGGGRVVLGQEPILAPIVNIDNN